MISGTTAPDGRRGSLLFGVRRNSSVRKRSQRVWFKEISTSFFIFSIRQREQKGFGRFKIPLCGEKHHNGRVIPTADYFQHQILRTIANNIFENIAQLYCHSRSYSSKKFTFRNNGQQCFPSQDSEWFWRSLWWYCIYENKQKAKSNTVE